MSNNIYNILGKLNSLQPKETPETVEQKPVYESVAARGSVLEGVAKVESRLARMFAEEKANEDMLSKKDYDGDGKKESPKDEYMGSKDKAIKKSMGKKDLDEETHGQYLAQKEKEAQQSGKSSFQAFKQTHPVDGKPGVEEGAECSDCGHDPCDCEQEVNEGFDDLQKYMADKAKGAKQGGGAGKKQGTRYGGGLQKDDEGDKEEATADAPKKKGRPKKDKFAESAESTGTMLVESALDRIAHQYSREVKDFMSGGDMDDDLFSALYDYYFDDMPYGVKKARDGDPYAWVADKFQADMGGNDISEVVAPAPMAESGAFIPGREVYWNGRSGTVDRVEGNKCFVNKANGEMDVWPTREVSTEPQKSNPLKNVGTGIKNFVMGKPEPMDEELNELAKLAGLSEAKKCNHTMEGEKCPVHGLKECGSGMYESAKPDYIDLDKDGDKEESMKDAAKDAEQVDEAGDFIKGMKRFVKGKDSAQDVLDRRLGKVSAADDISSLGKEASRYAKVQKVVDKNLEECGPGTMSNMGQDEGNMSINTSMNSDGTKSVSVNATGNQADALAQILKMAGLAAHHAVHGGEEPQGIVIQAGPEEQVEEERDVQYANTPDEEVENVDAIMHQGNDLNREKEQYAGMAKAGDNPMATRESIEMPKRISRMLEGVKLVDAK